MVRGWGGSAEKDEAQCSGANSLKSLCLVIVDLRDSQKSDPNVPSGYVNSLLLKIIIYSGFTH